MNFREMRARLIGSYGPFVFFPEDPEVPKLIETKAFTHLVIDEDIRVYAHPTMKEDLEEIEENYEIIYDTPHLKGEYYVSPYARLYNLNFKYKNGGEILKKAMRKPFPEEIEILVSLGKKIQSSIDKFLREVKFGMKEGDMKSLLECIMLENGIENFLYPTIVASGKETLKVFPRMKNERIKEGEIIYIDSSPMLQGYYLNFSRVIFTEEREEWISALKKINGMYAKLSTIVKSGVSCNFIDSIVREVGEFPHYSVVPASGFYMPYAPSSDIVEENMVFTVVPSIYLEKGVIRVKRNVMVGKNSIKFLD